MRNEARRKTANEIKRDFKRMLRDQSIRNKARHFAAVIGRVSPDDLEGNLLAELWLTNTWSRLMRYGTT